MKVENIGAYVLHRHPWDAYASDLSGETARGTPGESLRGFESRPSLLIASDDDCWHQSKPSASDGQARLSGSSRSIALTLSDMTLAHTQ